MSCLRLLLRTRNNNLIKYIRNLSTINNHIVSSKVPEVEIPNILLHEYLWKNVDKWNDKVAVECVETRRRLKYSDVYKMSKSFAGFLQKIGLNKGDTVAIILPNVPEYFVALLGSMQAGVIISTINPIYTSDEIKKQVINCKAKCIIALNSLYPQVKEAIQGMSPLPVITINHAQNESSYDGVIKFSEICWNNYDFKPVPADPNDVVLLPYSSGTTGLPKGVQLTHRNLISNYLQTSVSEFQLNTETHGTHQDVIPICLPMYHLYGLGVVALNFFSLGAKFITVPQFSTKSFSEVLHKDQPSLLYIVPPIVLMMLNNPDLHIEKLETRAVVSAAAPLGAADINRFRDKTNDRVHLLQIYGLTETAPLTHHQSFILEDGIKIGGSGLILPNTFCKIVKVGDETNTGLGPHQSGELLIKGPQVMKGYNNEDANKDIFVPDGNDKWLRTGDIAHYDEDGHFFITDRLKELIKVKGFQVAPAELEELLRSHPEIKDAAVIGISDVESGEVPKAFVVINENSKLTSNEIQSFVAKKVVKYKHLKGGVVIMDAIPKTASGKILRRDLKKLHS